MAFTPALPVSGKVFPLYICQGSHFIAFKGLLKDHILIEAYADHRGWTKYMRSFQTSHVEALSAE